MLRGPRLFLSPAAVSDSLGVWSALRCFSNKSPKALEYCYRGFSGLLGGGLKSALVLEGGPWLWIGVSGGPGHSSLGTVSIPRIAFPGTFPPQTPRAQSLLARAPGGIWFFDKFSKFLSLVLSKPLLAVRWPLLGFGKVRSWVSPT